MLTYGIPPEFRGGVHLFILARGPGLDGVLLALVVQGRETESADVAHIAETFFDTVAAWTASGEKSTHGEP